MTAENVIVLWIQTQTEQKDITGNLPVYPLLSERKEWRKERDTAWLRAQTMLCSP